MLDVGFVHQVFVFFEHLACRWVEQLLFDRCVHGQHLAYLLGQGSLLLVAAFAFDELVVLLEKLLDVSVIGGQQLDCVGGWRGVSPGFGTGGHDALNRKLPCAYAAAMNGLKVRLADQRPKLATRQASQQVIGAIAEALPNLLGGSADLTHSNLTLAKTQSPVQRESFRGNYIHYGVREHVVSVTRDDLVGQYIGHTAPKTKEILKKAMGGVLFIDEAYYLYRPENERDYGQEAIEILLQVMESQREDLVVILAGYGERMETFFQSNPGFRSRIAHHVDFPDYSDVELLAIAELMLAEQNYRFSPGAREAFIRYIAARKVQPLFSNARSIRNALDRVRLRQANRIVSDLDRILTSDDVMSIEAEDVLASRVFAAAAVASKG